MTMYVSLPIEGSRSLSLSLAPCWFLSLPLLGGGAWACLLATTISSDPRQPPPFQNGPVTSQASSPSPIRSRHSACATGQRDSQMPSSARSDSDVVVTPPPSTLPPTANSRSISATQPIHETPPNMVQSEWDQPDYLSISIRSHTLDDSLWRIQVLLDSELMYHLMDPYERSFTRMFFVFFCSLSLPYSSVPPSSWPTSMRAAGGMRSGLVAYNSGCSECPIACSHPGTSCPGVPRTSSSGSDALNAERGTYVILRGIVRRKQLALCILL